MASVQSGLRSLVGNGPLHHHDRGGAIDCADQRSLRRSRCITCGLEVRLGVAIGVARARTSATMDASGSTAHHDVHDHLADEAWPIA